jgi:hypothetical protein
MSGYSSEQTFAWTVPSAKEEMVFSPRRVRAWLQMVTSVSFTATLHLPKKTSEGGKRRGKKPSLVHAT